ncbi:MAG: 50S ribosomal protein L35 [Candidatus Gracilibacteria bacterium]|nr:50S ribosomal protein L35 [Candidatus Gracilibacteria bacterium]
MKQKTHSGAKKRVKVTGSGKLLLQKACKNHLLSSKSKRQKKADRLGKSTGKGNQKTLANLLNISR